MAVGAQEQRGCWPARHLATCKRAQAPLQGPGEERFRNNRRCAPPQEDVSCVASAPQAAKGACE
eukprot:9762961-Alexandrium_andersonii.AAC.1